MMFEKILVPIDLGDKDKGARSIKLTKEMVQSKDVSITLLNIIPQIPGFVVSELPADYQQKMIEESQEQLEKVAADAAFSGATTIKIKSGIPSDRIIEVADEENIDLIIMPSHQPSWEDYLFGSVAAEVVKNAKCSVLVER